MLGLGLTYYGDKFHYQGGKKVRQRVVMAREVCIGIGLVFE